LTTALAAFLFAIFAVLGAAAYFLLRVLLRRAGRVGPAARAERAVRAAAFGLAGAGAVCVAYGRLVEPFWPEVVRVRVESEAWPASAGPLRIVHISDVHSDPAPRLEERLPSLIAAERPDLIVFTGDALNDPAGLPVFRSLISRLSGIAPVLAVRGNWDVWYWSELDLLGGTGAQELDARGAALAVRGATVFVAGAPVGRAASGLAARGGAPAGALRVFLYHYPDEVYAADAAGADVYLAGHTHGGQVALPGYGALVTLSRFGKRFEAGLYRVGRTQLYVNRGIGMEGGSAPRVRFWARPEITVIDVVGRGASRR
jgi:uncharacterized protein